PSRNAFSVARLRGGYVSGTLGANGELAAFLRTGLGGEQNDFDDVDGALGDFLEAGVQDFDLPQGPVVVFQKAEFAVKSVAQLRPLDRLGHSVALGAADIVVNQRGFARAEESDVIQIDVVVFLAHFSEVLEEVQRAPE